MRFLLLIPVLLAFIGMEIFIGGARLAYALPGICLIAVGGLLSALPKQKFDPRASLLALVSAFLFSAYILVRNRLSDVDYIGRLQFFIMGGCFLAYLLFALFLTRPQDRKLFLYVLLAMAVAQVLVGVAQFTQHNQWMPLPWAQRRDDFWRASGLFISPNHFAGYLEIMALFAISLVIWGRSTITIRLLVGYVALVCVAGIALSGSRGGYLSLTFGSVVLMVLTLVAWHRLRSRHFALIAILSSVAAILLFAGIVFLMFQSSAVRERVIAINDPENMRLMLWDSALEQFGNNPAFGTGAFSFLYFGRLYRNPAVQNDPIHVHNDYLQLLADYGIVAAVLFSLLLLVHLVVGGRSFLRLVRSSHGSGDSQSDALALNIGALSCVAAYMVHSVVDFNMQIPINGVLMGVVFAVLANSRRTSSDREGLSKPGPAMLFFRILLPIGSIALLLYGAPMIQGEIFGERARIALRDGNLQEGLDFARKALETEKKNPDVYYHAGEALRALAARGEGDRKALAAQSVEMFGAGLGVFPYDSRLSVKLAQAQSEAGDYLSASQTMTYAEQLDPNSSFISLYRGIVELESGYLDDAELAFKEAIERGGEGATVAQSLLDLTHKAQEKQALPPGSSPAPLEENLKKQIESNTFGTDAFSGKNSSEVREKNSAGDGDLNKIPKPQDVMPNKKSEK